MSVIFTGIRVTSLADVDTVYSWIQRWRIEPDACIGISPADRPNVVSSGNVVFSTNPSFSDGVKWDDHTRKSLEKKGKRTLWVVSGLQNEAMKRYSIPLVHHGSKCSLIAYLLDGDNLPSAAFISTPPSPMGSRNGPPSNLNEPIQASETDQSTNKPPELSSSAMERIKTVVKALAVEMDLDVHILLTFIVEVFGRKLGSVEPGEPLALAECSFSTRGPRETQQAEGFSQGIGNATGQATPNASRYVHPNYPSAADAFSGVPTQYGQPSLSYLELNSSIGWYPSHHQVVSGPSDSLLMSSGDANGDQGFFTQDMSCLNGRANSMAISYDSVMHLHQAPTAPPSQPSIAVGQDDSLSYLNNACFQVSTVSPVPTRQDDLPTPDYSDCSFQIHNAFSQVSTASSFHSSILAGRDDSLRVNYVENSYHPSMGDDSRKSLLSNYTNRPGHWHPDDAYFQVPTQGNWQPLDCTNPPSHHCYAFPQVSTASSLQYQSLIPSTHGRLTMSSDPDQVSTVSLQSSIPARANNSPSLEPPSHVPYSQMVAVNGCWTT